jgi:hypothetical protein
LKRLSFLVVMVAVAVLAGSAAAVDSSLPGGTSISVDIDSPLDGATVDQTVEVTGTASIGNGSAVKDTTLVYAVDTSLSTAFLAGVNCVPGFGDTVLACEKEAVRRVNLAAQSGLSPVANSGLARFSTTGTAVPLTGGSPYLVTPGPVIDTAVGGFTAGGGTSFVAGLNAAKTVLTDPAVQDGKIIVFLSDGGDTAGGTLPMLEGTLEGTIVQAFAIGGGCATGSPSLNAVAARGAPGSACTRVTNLSVLDQLIMESIAASLDSLTLTVDGTSVPVTTSVGLPTNAPATVSWNATTGELSTGPHELCATATGTDAGGSDSVSECVDVTVFEVTVNCAPNCTLTLADGNTSVANFAGFNLNKVVGMSAFGTGDAGDCGDLACVSTYEVGFADNGGGGVAELTVLMAKAFSVPPAQAEVYFDGELLTAKCTSPPSPIPCQKVTSDNAGQTKYFVRFNADPRFGFR